MKNRIAILILAFLTVAFSGCECEHQWRREIVNESTCLQAGTIRDVCTKCGFYKESTIHKKSHDFETVSTIKKTTCTEDGIYIEKCKKCGETKEGTIKAQHVFSNRVCMNCGYVKPREKISIGQSKSQVRSGWGEPTDIDTYTFDLGTFETWWYKENGKVVCVSFDENGLVDSIQY